MDNPLTLHMYLIFQPSFLIEFICFLCISPLLSWVIFEKNMLRPACTNFLLSKIDNLCLSLQLLPKSMLLLLLGLLCAPFETLT